MTTTQRTGHIQHGGVAASQSALHPTEALTALAQRLSGHTLDAGTTALVHQLLEAVERTGAEATVLLRTDDELHQGFSERVLDIADRLEAEGKAELSVILQNHDRQFEMRLLLTGDPDVVARTKADVAAAARGATDFAWQD